MTTTPGLAPSFASGVFDYVVRCTGQPTTTLATTGSGTVVIGGKTYAQPATVPLRLVANQAVTISSGSDQYTIRCLPADFPNYSAQISGTPQSRGYLVALIPWPRGSTAATNYVIAFDSHGVPVWWYKSAGNPYNAAFYGSDKVGWWTGSKYSGTGVGTYTIRDLDGNVTAAVGGPSAGTGINAHDFQILPNGDYLGIQYVKTTLNLTSWGLSAERPVFDCQIVEIDPAGAIVWRWSTIAHIDVAQANVNWHNEVPDVIHMNSIQEVGNEIIFSARHLDAVYAIDRTTGNVLWKVGGSSTPQSLTVVGNTYPQVFSGQHDARLRSDGTLTVHDNATQETGHPVRALAFHIDVATRTATVVQDVTDPNFDQTSSSIGSVDLLPGGNWLVDWGTADYVAELTPQGASVIRIVYPDFITYRAAPVTDSDSVLSHAMDARFPPLEL